MRVTSTGDQILAAALQVLAESGDAGLTMDRVRRTAEVSNGSLYHHFASRGHLTARLLLVGMTACQDGILGALGAAVDARTGVEGVVRAQLMWVEHQPELARLLYGDLSDEVLLAAEPQFSTANRAYVEVISDWLGTQTERAEMIDGPFSIVHALWLGPAQEFSRHWLQGRSPLAPSEAAQDLAEGAWRALASR